MCNPKMQISGYTRQILWKNQHTTYYKNNCNRQSRENNTNIKQTLQYYAMLRNNTNTLYKHHSIILCQGAKWKHTDNAVY